MKHQVKFLKYDRSEVNKANIKVFIPFSHIKKRYETSEEFYVEFRKISFKFLILQHQD